MPSISTLIAVLAILGAPASAFWRMPCPSRLIQERIDPIIAPGNISAHVHTVAGGNGFGYTTSYDQMRSSQCSSCPIQEDLSAYWTPKLYFKAQNNSFIGVPQAGDGPGTAGGMTVYYLQRPGPKNDKLVAFPAGFRMVAGNPYQRNYTGTFAAQGISYVCLDYSGTSSETNAFPTKNCPDGVRTQVFFPSCWDGVNTDSPSHESHVSYPESGAYNSGTCPSTHPVHLVSLFYETIWQTNLFANEWYGIEQPFVFAMGDPTGYGGHGDFINGWDVPTLQNAIDHCTDLSGDMTSCSYFNFFTSQQSQACKVPVTLSTNVDGPIKALPGCNPVTPGPAMAIPPATCNRIPQIFPPKQAYTDQTSKGYKYIGCGIDDVNSRTLTGPTSFTSSMTVDTCVSFCKSAGYTYAGLEYASQCFCGNSLASDREPQPGVVGACTMPCAGNSAEICGAGNALSIYQACERGSCTNAQAIVVGGLPAKPAQVKRVARVLGGVV